MPAVELPAIWSISYGILLPGPWPKVYQEEIGDDYIYDMIYVYARIDPYDPGLNEIIRAWIYFNLDGFPTGFTPTQALLKLWFYLYGPGSTGPFRFQIRKTDTPGEPPLLIAPQYFNYNYFTDQGSEMIDMVEGENVILLTSEILSQIAARCSSPPPREPLVLGVRSEVDTDSENPPDPGQAAVFYGWQYLHPPILRVTYEETQRRATRGARYEV